ncbi:MAG: ABC-2 family transporter protein [Anaerolineae bacterium]|nr:ABC-2 family transporter protein [Anaerolineae bacterium]
MAIMMYRLSFFFTVIGNLLYIVLLYFLWSSIYRGVETIRGMSFNQAFVYVALAGSIFTMVKTWADWEISWHITSGSIIMDLVKPLDFQFYFLSQTVGFMAFNFIMIALPSALVLLLFFGADVEMGVGLLFLPAGLILAFLISFAIDYIIGLTSFYTESIWGISMTKEIITTLLSGALVPLQFFPDAAQRILRLLPFQAIYHIPLTMLTAPNLDVRACLGLLGTQVVWVVLLFLAGRLLFTRASRVLMVSGG